MQANNVVVKEWGTFDKAEHHCFNHVDLVNLLGIADLENGSTVAGGRGYFLKGAGVLLNQALINCAIQHAYKRGSDPVQTPFFMRKSIMAECAQLKEFDEALYHVRHPHNTEGPLSCSLAWLQHA
jgi:seryl-tRNA synthetase